MRLACCNCGAEFSISQDQVPETGLNGSCRKCGTAITVFQNGTVQRRGGVPGGGGEVSPQPQPSAVPQQQSIEFGCPSCSHRHRLPLERIPVAGASGACAACNTKLVVFRDGTARIKGAAAVQLAQSTTGVQGHAAVTPPPPMDPSGRWEIQLDGQSLGPFALADIKNLVMADRLPPDRLIRPVGGEWAAAAVYPAIAAFYAPHETAVPERMGSEDECFTHRTARPTHQCSQCGRFLCPSCVKQVPAPNVVKPLNLCSACGGPVIELKRRARWTPFYRDMKHALLLPLRFGHPLLYFGILTATEIMKVPCSVVPLWGTLAVLIITCFQTSFYIHLIKAVGNGCYDFPDWPDVDNFIDMLFTLLKVVFVSIVALIPVILIGCLSGMGLGVVAGLAGGAGAESAVSSAVGLWLLLFSLLALFYVVYLPVCIAIVAIFNTVLPALNPVIIFRIIFRIGPTYFMAVAIWIAMGVINVVAGMILGRLGLVGNFMVAPVSVYINLVCGYILGRVAYENEERIGWH